MQGSLTGPLLKDEPLSPACAHQGRATGMWRAGGQETPLLRLPELCTRRGRRERCLIPESHPLPLEYPWAPRPQPGAEQKETNDLVIALALKV